MIPLHFKNGCCQRMVNYISCIYHLAIIFDLGQNAHSVLCWTCISYGVISVPELTDWHPLTANDSYLVAASDGIFEKLSLQDVCDLLWEVQSHGPPRSELSTSCSYSLADCIVNTAFEKGSMDNLAAVVVPLASTHFSGNQLKERLNRVGDQSAPALGLQKSMYNFPGVSLCF